jgi:hypothetical protein
VQPGHQSDKQHVSVDHTKNKRTEVRKTAERTGLRPTGPAQTKHQLYTNYTPTIHQLYTNYTPTIHQLYTNYTPTIDQLYTNYTPTIHQLYTNYTPTIHQLKQQSQTAESRTYNKNKTATCAGFELRSLLFAPN